jgi:uncharacterized protein (TIGR02246 family)
MAVMEDISTSRHSPLSNSITAPARETIAPYVQGDADIPGAEQFMTNWDQAWGAHDAHGLAQLHTEDAVTVNRYGTLLQGRVATEKALAFLHGDAGPFGHSEFPPLRMLALRQITPDVMILQTGWKNPVMHSNGKPDAAQVNEMIVTFVLLKIGEEWKASQIDPHNVDKMDLPYSNPGQKD